MHDLIFVSLENWDEVWRRNQFLCAGLAQRFPQRKILFVGQPRCVATMAREGKAALLRGLRQAATWTVPAHPNITVTQPLKLLPNTLPGARRFNQAAARSHIRRAALRAGIRRPILWLNPHDALHMAGKMGECALIYDITDDWSAFTQTAPARRRMVAQDAALCRRADAVIVCSQRLHDLKKPLARRLHLIPNGVDAAHYSGVLDKSGPLPQALAGCPHPILGYTGTVHSDRVDVALLEDVARRLKGGTIALVGPMMLQQAEQARLRACGNVVMTGQVAYEEVPCFMRAFDVCITPHRMTPFTESLNPIKLWEYLAAGKPIVSTDVAGFRDYPQLVHLARCSEEFVAAVDAALHEDPGLAARRRAVVASQSWQARLDDVVEVFEEVAASKKEEKEKAV